MAWIIIITAGVVLLAAFLAFKLQQLTNDIYRFSKSLDNSLDEMLSGKELTLAETYEDSLWEKTYDKLQRIQTVWNRQAEYAKKEKAQLKELISDISHQTKTPIANIKAYQELLSEEELSENSRNFLEHMQTQTDKLDFLLSCMVKMSRLETGIINIQTNKADLFQTLRTAIAAVVPKTEKKQISLSVDCANPLLICHDPKWTAEALFNLLDNAAKYTDAGGAIQIQVSIQEVFTKISIKDTGKGILPERHAAIFTRFYREPEVHALEGIGIGLYLTRKIIELQGGYIEVDSDVGKGAEFQVYLINKIE